MDAIRGKIMEKIATRQSIASRLVGPILPSVIHELNTKSRSLPYEVRGCGGLKAEISGVTRENAPWRHAVNLDTRTCSCGQWRLSGKPCTHVIAFVGSLRQVKIEDYVHYYYSVDRFKATYQFDINPMVDKTQWPVVDPLSVIVPPTLERPAGRPRVRRIKSSGEAGKRGPYQCKRCFGFGHFEKTCREPPAELGAELPPLIPAKSRKRKGVVASSSRDAAVQAPSKSKRTSKLSSTTSPVSPGPTTRSMAASPSTPTSSGPVTRRRAAELAISPGGIARRLIIN